MMSGTCLARLLLVLLLSCSRLKSKPYWRASISCCARGSFLNCSICAWLMFWPTPWAWACAAGLAVRAVMAVTLRALSVVRLRAAVAATAAVASLSFLVIMRRITCCLLLCTLVRVLSAFAWLRLGLLAAAWALMLHAFDDGISAWVEALFLLAIDHF